jgi:uncharacterized membrane protein
MMMTPMPTAAIPVPASRVRAIDIVRGAVMVLMALDHVRDWTTGLRFQPENLARASAMLFATRWVTHICAPTFFLLAGVGIGLLRRRQGATAALSRYVAVRGLWLLVLELVITPIGWQFGFDLVPAFAIVLWTLGWSMVLMAVLVHVPVKPLLIVSIAVIAGHNLLDGIRPAQLGGFAPLWHVLHVPGFAIPGVLFVAYPLIPWVFVMALGSTLAVIYDWDPARRRRLLLWCGSGAILLFVVLRTVNGYGDPAPWSAQRTPALTVASFLNARKYPPSLDFLLMTLGPALIALALAEHARGRIAAWLSVYGRVPLFFYVVHIFVAHGLAVSLAFWQGGELRRILVINDPGSIPDWYGLPLPGVYAMWMAVVLLMYPLCRWYAGVKKRRTDWWLRYL